LTNLIRLDVKKETSTIIFNAADLKLNDASLYSDTLKLKQVDTSRSLDDKAERGVLSFSTPLPAGSKATLSIAFSGELTGSMMGYYKSSFEHEGTKKYYTLTQFEVRINITSCARAHGSALAHRCQACLPLLG
jgi:aminopeptidase 2